MAGEIWLVEEGIGEDRALLMRDDTVVAARLDWPGKPAAGMVAEARLIARIAGTPRGYVRLADGHEASIDHLPRDAKEGATLGVIVTRGAIAEKGRLKLPRCRPSDEAPRPAPSLIERLRAEGAEARIARRFPAGLWEDIWCEAWSGEHDFAGGALLVSPTPAMTLIDIDGPLAPRLLALAAAPAVAAIIARMDLAGSIGIDFPSLPDKADRRAVDTALADALPGWPHERTAMNGFGFVQIVARLERPSLLALQAMDRAGAAARLLLRRAEAMDDPGTLSITAHPSVIAAIRPDWIAALTRRCGRAITWQDDPALALDGGFAQAVRT